MKIFFILWLFIAFVVYSNFEDVKIFFLSTLTFNLAVLTMLTMGVIIILNSSFQLITLSGTFGILAYKRQNYEFYLTSINRVFPPNIAQMFLSRKHKEHMVFTQEEADDVLTWFHNKFFNQKGYINFFISTSLMIGLLGTFTGLITAVNDMGEIILSLSGDINISAIMADFAGPLSGMAVGFGSSIFGVVSAIILGVMAFILTRNQEQFIDGVEDWLKGKIVYVDGDVDNLETNEASQSKTNFLDLFMDKLDDMTTEMKGLRQSGENIYSIADLINNINNNLEDKKEILNKLTRIQTESSQKSFKGIRGLHDALEAIDEKMMLELNKFDSLSSVIESFKHTNHENKEDLQNDLKTIKSSLTQELELLKKIGSLDKFSAQKSSEHTKLLEQIVSGIRTGSVGASSSAVPSSSNDPSFSYDAGALVDQMETFTDRLQIEMSKEISELTDIKAYMKSISESMASFESTLKEHEEIHDKKGLFGKMFSR
jgi:biopolymer transport protein ExbB/TolQ